MEAQALQRAAPNDHGRSTCALLVAMDEGSYKGMMPHHLPTACLSVKVGSTITLSAATGFVQQMEARDVLRPQVELLLRHIEVLGAPQPLHVQSAIARHIRSTMHIENQALSMEDTLALVTTGLEATSDEATLVTNMFNLMSDEYTGLRLLETVDLSVDKLCGWHEKMFAGVAGFRDKNVGRVRQCGVQAGPRLCPSRSIVDDELPVLCAVVTDFCARWKTGKPESRTDTVLHLFALAAFTQFHFVDLHPFADGNGRMCRYVCKYLLESCLPLPFPMYDSRDEYLAALRAGDAAVDSGNALFAPITLLEKTIESAVTFYAELTSFVVTPFLVSPTWQGILQSVETRELHLTPDDLGALSAQFEALPVFGSATTLLSIGDVRVTKTKALLQLTAGYAEVPLLADVPPPAAGSAPSATGE